MGGKKKTGHAQPRTKENLKPSSSEKAAQFLVNQTGGLGLPFPLLSLSAPKGATSSVTDPDQLGRITGFVPVPQDPDAVGLDSRLLSILRRLEKRDSVTKQKALREFHELLKATDEQSSSDLETSAVVATLPFWCRIYTRLSSDPDRKVRELLQMSMSALAARVGREIGPYIKQILPIWAFATVDFHEPAASWANRGLSDTFPNAKRSDAYKVCARTLLDLLEAKLSEDLMAVSNLINEKGRKKYVLNMSGNTETSAMSDLESCETNAWVKLAGTLRFVATVAIEIGSLPSDSRHLERLRVLLSPCNLWSRVAQILECQISSSSPGYRTVAGNSSLVRASLYKLCTALCSNQNWQDWIATTPKGNQLASYLCLSTIGQLGLILGDALPSGVLSGYKLIPPPPSSLPVPSCYAQCWESALSCLVNVPGDIVWAAVDWKSVLVPQLERLLSPSGVPYAKQVYSNLLSILSKFPIEYDAMTPTQEDILMFLFVDSALSGLEASLTPRVSSGIDDPKAPVTVHVDPGIPVSIVTGVLECARFLIDKLATAFPQLSSDDLPTQSPLLHAIVHKVVIRLLADSLDVLSDHRMLLVSSQPATYRETYLNAVFSQVAQLCGHLGRSELVSKLTLLSEIHKHLIKWISSTVMSSDTQHTETPFAEFRLGSMDPLRLLKFIDQLAMAGRRDGNILDTMKEDFEFVRASWCVRLFSDVSEHVAKTDNEALQIPLRSCLFIICLCLQGYLPPNYTVSVPPIADKLFSVILPGLPMDVHAGCWSKSVVTGFIRAWCKSSIVTEEIVPFTIQFRFLRNLLPALVALSLPSDLIRDLCNLLSSWCSSSLDIIFNNVTIANVHAVSTSLSLLHATLSVLFNQTVDRNSELVELRKLVLGKVTCYLSRQLPESSDVLLPHTLSPRVLRNLTLCVTVLLETVSITPGDTEPSLEFTNHWHLQLCRLLFALFSVEHFAHVNKNLSSNSELTDLILPSHESLAASQDEEPLYSRCLDLFEVIDQAEELLFSYLSLDVGNVEAVDCPSEFTYSLHQLLISAVVYLPYVPSRLIRFAERLRKLLHDPSLSPLWLSELAETIKQTVRKIVSDFSEPTTLSPPSRHLLPGFGCAVDAWCMGPSMRLHELGLRLGLPQELKSNVTRWNVYLQCLGILRVWLCSLGDTYDPCVAFGWPIEKRTDIVESDNKYSGVDLEPARSVFGQVVDSYASELGRMWYQNTADIPLDELFELMQTDYHSISPLACANIQDCFLVHSLLNAVLLNRLRTVHPNLWPHHFKLIAGCTDDPKQPHSSWSERHLFSDGCFNQPSGAIQFRQLCELYIPAGVVRRCVPHQELLGRMKSLAVAPTTLSDCESTTNCAKASRILELGSSLFSVRSVSPVYMTTFLSFITDDFNAWLTELVEGSNGDELPGLLAFQSGFVASLATMEFLESLLLLWQPWQWRPTHVTDKATFTNHLCLIQLSLRLEQLRPSLTRSQWDFIMCITVSWICAAVAGASDVTDPSSHKTLFGFRVFRVAAALGAIFVEKFPPPKDLSYFLIPTTTPLKSAVSHFGGGEWDDDLDAEAEELDLKEDALVTDDASTKREHQEVFDETQLLDTFQDDHDELEAALTEEEDNRESSPNMQHPVLPRRARPPVSISTDWEQFFSSHFYSSLLPVILKLCLPQPGLIQPGCKLVTPVQLEAACAAFATCSAIKLIQVLTEQPHFVVEYLVDLDIGGSSSVAYTPLIRSRTSSVNELTPGLRASFDLAIRLLRFSPYQSGQLLGHILLTRLVCAHTNRTDGNKTYGLSSYLIHRLPPSWLTALYDSLPAELEQDLVSESLSNNWGRGSRVLRYLLKYSLQDGWFLDVMAHQSILRYLLAWDGILSLFSCTGSQGRARLQRALLGSAAPLFDRFVLCLGLLIPPPGNLATFINTPSRLEPDERLLLPVSASRADLIVALSLISPSRQRRPIRLSVPLTSGDDREWRDAFAPDDPLLALSGVRIARDISHLAVRLFRRLLAEAPALFRSWFTRISSPSTADPCCLDGESFPLVISPLTAHKPGRLRQLANTIEAIVSRHFSPGLARDEVVMVQYRAQLREMKRDNTTPKGWFDFLSPSNEVGSISIRSRPLSREVIARYQVTEEHSMEMSIQLPTNYPLGLATVTCDRAVAISSQQGNVWSVQLSVFINNQNGSILDGIDLWQRNVRKKFEGVEECAICYSVVHNTNFSLPKMQCHTCRKLFHYACMYRWFTTSRNPACPLCRHMFFGPSGRPT
ncbi:hypothetical protein T265_14772 [Opisthorchis viverrini]|uniref:E3 ubiquitin-protein ligase listerin n=1 Tax=Opisthorchis viverrini TaxID=6198 RepID=A0A074Z6X1_OPIVI|nr:hypothetical protein T265_14772 [Opisthorchis viverrini]KER22838.1 hypothetical protein T265_14772 [Opisthorchis viverrini]